MGETLGQGVQKDDCERRRGEQQTDPIDKKCRANKEQGTDQACGDGCSLAEKLMTSGGAGIPLIDLPIGDAVEGHRRSTGKDHAEQDKPKQPPPRKTSRGTRCDHHRPKGKRQGEYRVRKPDEG